MASTKKTTNFHDLINGDRPVLIDFYADWCGPCKMFAPQLEQFKNEIGDAIRVVKIDVDRNEEIASQLQVRSIPTVMIFHQGELKWRQAGVPPIPMLREQIQALLN